MGWAGDTVLAGGATGAKVWGQGSTQPLGDHRFTVAAA